jgi:tetratricopeptide (TPR) repeat protein
MVVVALAVTVVYWPSFSVPFYLDDFPSIAENPAIQDPANLGAIWDFSKERFFGYLTFALNRGLNGDQVAGYHITNASIHLIAGWALLGLLAALVRSPAMQARQSEWLHLVPFIAALLFVLHPLQTQAVTYVVQRLASLSAMLYISSLACYAWGRITAKPGLFGLALVCNAYTLPAAILLLELLFFRALSVKQRWGLFIVAITSITVVTGAFNLEALDRLTRETSDISRADYFATQLLVLWRYAGLFFYPWQQRLEYDIGLQTDFMDPLLLVALCAHLALVLFAFWIWSRAPLVSFGIFFFYLAHLVESSFLPITDLMFEHRTYLPNMGLSMLVAVGITKLIGYRPLRPVVIIATALILTLSGWLTAERNRLWQDPIAFLKAETQLTPGKERVWTSYGKELMRRGRFKEALLAFGTALNLGRTEDGLEVSSTTLMNAIMALHYTSQYRKAFELERLLPLDVLMPVERSRLHEVKGMSFLKLRQLDRAREEFLQALRFFANPNAEAGLATVDLMQGKHKAAELRARKVLSEQPENILAQEVIKRIRESNPANNDARRRQVAEEQTPESP